MPGCRRVLRVRQAKTQPNRYPEQEILMTIIMPMVEQHILESESGRKHVDELLARARQRTGEGPEHVDARARLDELTKEHGRLSDHLEELKNRNIDDWREEKIEQAGPMGIWDALAEDAEMLLEKLEKK